MKRKILLVNSAETAFFTQRSIFGREGLEVLAAADFEDAVRIHRQQRVDLIVADVGAPGGNGGGRKNCSGLLVHEELRQVPLILLCGTDAEEKAWAYGCSANAVIEKPFSHDRLHDHVAEFLALNPRRHRRVLVTIEVDVAVGRSTFNCMSQNLSVSGMHIETDGELPMGEQVQCSFILASRWIMVLGEVVRAYSLSPGSNHYGIRFINLDDELCDLIETYVEGAVGIA